MYFHASVGHGFPLFVPERISIGKDLQNLANGLACSRPFPS